MNEKRLYQVLIGPYTTEKSVAVAEAHNQNVFRVAKDATKSEIKEAVSKLFNVVVESVRTVQVTGKTKRFKQKEGRRSDWKKAYVAIQKGQDINLANYQ
jgi:large subunit ribosomal protein L23